MVGYSKVAKVLGVVAVAVYVAVFLTSLFLQTKLWFWGYYYLSDSAFLVNLISGYAWFFGYVLSLVGIIGGIGLVMLKGWGRKLLIVVSILGLLAFPVGTVLGLFYLVVLSNSGVKSALQ